MSAMMIDRVKMIADRIALCGVDRFMTFKRLQLRIEARNIAGMIAKYFATSLANRECRKRAARHQELLADLDDSR